MKSEFLLGSCISFGEWLKIDELNDSYAFCVYPWLHLSRKSLVVSLINNGFNTSTLALVGSHSVGLHVFWPVGMSLYYSQQLLFPFEHWSCFGWSTVLGSGL